MTRWIALAAVAAAGACSADPPAMPATRPSQTRPVHTFSIVARDAKTGEIGVAVQSHWFSVGTVVTWAEAGVGAVATQSFAEPAYGPRGLELMRSGLSASKALAALLKVDDAEAVRQIAFIDVDGDVAAHTGKSCIEFAGHKTGENFSVQANMMLNDKVVPAMARAFRTTKGKLPERLVAALEAGQKAGGDIRGRQSAALLVVKGKGTGEPWKDRVVELRVEDHETPVKELRRLLTLHRAYQHMNDGDVAMENKNITAALKHYRAANKLVPDNLEMQYWHAVLLASNGRMKQALPMFRKIFAADANWRELTKRLDKPGILEKKTINKIVDGAN